MSLLLEGQPPPLTEGLVLHLSPAGVEVSGNQVARWRDLSGRGNHAVSEAEVPPPEVFTPRGTRPMVRFDGTQYLTVRGNPTDFDAGGVTWFTVFRPARFPPPLFTNQRVLSSAHSDIGGAGNIGQLSNTWSTRLGWNGNIRAGARTSSGGLAESNLSISGVEGFWVHRGVWDVTASTVQGNLDGHNAPLVTTANATPTGHRFLRIGGGSGSGDWENPPLAEGFVGDIAEILVYNRALAPAGQDEITSWLMKRHGKIEPEQSDVFVRGESGYYGFRIPAVLATRANTLLAFAEGRRDNLDDDGKIDLVLKRSFDGGRTWGPLRVVHAEGEETIGNPCPVMDRRNGRIWLPFTRNNREVFVTFSDDDGETWAAPREITSSVKAPSWRWYATGPGNGIQLADGRLVIPCNHGNPAVNGTTAHVILSDDGGETWKLGGVVHRRNASVEESTNEAQVVELADGRLMINMRTRREEPRRAVSFSHDRGQSWTPIRWEEELLEPFACQASLIRFSLPSHGGPERILFSNPNHPEQRRNMTVRVSYDGGETWPVSRALFTDFGGYSSLVVLPDGHIGMFTERDFQVQRLAFYRFSLEWLSEGFDGMDRTKPAFRAKAGTVLDGGDRFMTIRFPRPTFPGGIEHVVEGSGDLDQWNPLGVERIISWEENPGAGFDHVTYRDTVAITEGNRRFLRVRSIGRP